mgnify:CR=1 FL=1
MKLKITIVLLSTTGFIRSQETLIAQMNEGPNLMAQTNEEESELARAMDTYFSKSIDRRALWQHIPFVSAYRRVERGKTPICRV